MQVVWDDEVNVHCTALSLTHGRSLDLPARTASMQVLRSDSVSHRAATAAAGHPPLRTSGGICVTGRHHDPSLRVEPKPAVDASPGMRERGLANGDGHRGSSAPRRCQTRRGEEAEDG
eukprot:366407-Chlamydomonas_euryale.AAC.4